MAIEDTIANPKSKIVGEVRNRVSEVILDPGITVPIPHPTRIDKPIPTISVKRLRLRTWLFPSTIPSAEEIMGQEPDPVFH